MIVEPQQHWIRLIFVWHGSVCYTNLFHDCSLTFFAFYRRYHAYVFTMLNCIKFTLAPFSILGVAIAIFLGFRNNACYARYVKHATFVGAVDDRFTLNMLRGEKTTYLMNGIEDFVRFSMAFALFAYGVAWAAQVLGNYLTTGRRYQKVVALHSPPACLLLVWGWLAIRRRSGFPIFYFIASTTA